MQKLLPRIVLLLVILLLVNQLVIARLPYGWGDDLLADKYSYYLDAGGQYDTLFVGSSRVYRQMSPEVFDQRTRKNLGTHSFNMGVVAQDFAQSAQLYDRLLSLKPPRLRYAFFELRPVAYDPGAVNLHTKGLIYWYTPRATLFIVRTILAEELPLQDKLRLSGYHVMSLVEKLLNFGLGEDIIEYALQEPEVDAERLERSAGFIPLDFEESAATRNRRLGLVGNTYPLELRTLESETGMIEGEARLAYNEAFLAQLEGMIERSSEQGVKLVFVLPPRLGSDYKTLLPVFYRLPENHRIEVADPRKYPAYYSEKNAFDVGHLNRDGAELFTKKIADKMVSLVREEAKTPKSDNGQDKGTTNQ